MPRWLGMRRAVQRGRTSWEAAAAVAQARRLLRSHPAAIRVCWDLDNTLVDSGSLLRVGRTLQDAIVEAQPVPNMFAFYEAMRECLPESEHVIVTARRRSMRAETETWLRRNGFGAMPLTVCFVPSAAAKVRVWRELARDARLVIVDDLCYGHENATPSVYEELAMTAGRLAAVYVGRDEIAEIASSDRAVGRIASSAARSLEFGRNAIAVTSRE
jgi:hypothetical protein